MFSGKYFTNFLTGKKIAEVNNHGKDPFPDPDDLLPDPYPGQKSSAHNSA
jgi:hypothetical protein